MKERPILFSGPMVRALLDGSKTQTRRIVKPQPLQAVPTFDEGVWNGGMIDKCTVRYFGCPFGIAGDALWVRETWRCAGSEVSELGTDAVIEYRADGVRRVCADPLLQQPRRDGKGVWSPSIFMPRWACRIVLEITSVRVERVASISEADAMAEGIIKQVVTVGRAHGRPDYDMFALRPGDHCEWECTARDVYRKLWDSLNAKRGYGWAKNPWVWVITFQRKKGTEGGTTS